jgi:hypothetical protein
MVTPNLSQGDFRGCVYNAMKSFECVVRDITGDSEASLVEILEYYTDLLPKLLNEAILTICISLCKDASWIIEGRDEAEFLVSLFANVVTYLRKSEV